MKKLNLTLTGLLFPLLAQPLHAANYCAAIRGNGELMPAHWGAMARLTEESGLPQKVAGGSAGAITAFFLESIALNPLIVNQETDQQKARAAYLIKSLQGAFEFLTKKTKESTAVTAIFSDPDLKVLQGVLTQLSQLSNTGRPLTAKDFEAIKPVLGQVQGFLTKHEENFKELMASKEFKGLLNPEFEALIHSTFEDVVRASTGMRTQLTEAQLQFRLGEIQTAFKSFGAFDAVGDLNLFFRPGLLNFAGLAHLMGMVAGFYAQGPYSVGSQEAIAKFNKDLPDCAMLTLGQTWLEIRTSQNGQVLLCADTFYKAFGTHFAIAQQNPQLPSRLNDTIGENTLVSTAVITGRSAYEYSRMASAYKTATNLKFGDDFKLPLVQDFNFARSDLKFGYWSGRDTRTMQQRMRAKFNDEKSQRFFGLGAAQWRTILTMSPAEPGLANLQQLNSSHSKNGLMYSAAGWSDLQPVLALKVGMGCDQVVYVTRRGEESRFAKGIYRHLHQVTDTSEYWRQAHARLYDLLIPTSSFSRSLQMADAVLCTDWDNVKDGDDEGSDKLNELVDDAYNAPLFLKGATVDNEKFKGCR